MVRLDRSYGTLLEGDGYRGNGVVGSLVICASVLVHGVTATPLTELYGRLS